MMVIRTEVTADHRITAKDWREITKAAWQQLGEHWHRRILPRHFRAGASIEYRYAQRARSTEAKKRRIFGHNRPLEFRGHLKGDVMRVQDVRAVGSRLKSQAVGTATVRLHGPRYLRQVRAPGKGPDMGAELRAVSERDLQELAQLLERILTRELNRRGRTRRVGGRGA